MKSLQKILHVITSSRSCFLYVCMCVFHVPRVLLKDWWAVCSRPAGTPERCPAPSLEDEWLSSKTPDNQQHAHRHQSAGSHLK